METIGRRTAEGTLSDDGESIRAFVLNGSSSLRDWIIQTGRKLIVRWGYEDGLDNINLWQWISNKLP